VAASWDPAIAFAGGAMIGAEARADGFNVLLGGSVNLMREPRNGRNFEYAGEDPLLAGTIAGAAIAGVQSNQIVSTIKHFASTTRRPTAAPATRWSRKARCGCPTCSRSSSPSKRGSPGAADVRLQSRQRAVRLREPVLLTQVLRDEWHWPGYVLSDWGAVHSTVARSTAGLDQESGFGLQRADWFGADKLKAGARRGRDHPGADRPDGRPRALRDVRQRPGRPPRSAKASRSIRRAPRRSAGRAAEAGIVLLKNDEGPAAVSPGRDRILVIGGHADKGVLSGGGSSQVYPDGHQRRARDRADRLAGPGRVLSRRHRSKELRKLMPQATIDYVDGDDRAAAARQAAEADVVVVLRHAVGQREHRRESPARRRAGRADRGRGRRQRQHGGRARDRRPGADAVGRQGAGDRARPGTRAGPGRRGHRQRPHRPGQSLGHLPATFPASLDQLPHPGDPHKGDVGYSEGATVGYKWFDRDATSRCSRSGQASATPPFAHDHLAVAREGDGWWRWSR
jgi:beta-glucosidase